MYLFWFIPVALAVIAIIWVVFAAIKRRPLTPSQGRVLVDKPSEDPPPQSS